MGTQPGRIKRPRGAVETHRTSINVTRESLDAAEKISGALGISRDVYLDILLQREWDRRDQRDRPSWWTRRTAPKWWTDPDHRVSSTQTRSLGPPHTP